MKTKWVKKVPEKEGWYWIKYHGKHGMVKCPCSVYIFKEAVSINTARNDTFTVFNDSKYKETSLNTMWKRDKVAFGPEIPIP
jgi:hypothetical protein